QCESRYREKIEIHHEQQESNRKKKHAVNCFTPYVKNHPKKQHRQGGERQPRLQCSSPGHEKKQPDGDECPTPTRRSQRRVLEFVTIVPNQECDDERDNFGVFVICFRIPRLPRPGPGRKSAVSEKMKPTEEINE